ncbi:Uncharacterized protein FWK35_00001294 [Aphis craccivora]|uniref:Uncharacterized protein n=1 Tax=Aphis craccivora TaxID=307492 RepID=A0A6G0ZIN6_APHCR|nr:Uncharacterized protein FWK35_00001294 [Aphis craccivora]
MCLFHTSPTQNPVKAFIILIIFKLPVGLKLNSIHPPHDYVPVSASKLESPISGRLARGISFLQNLICDKTDSTSVLQHVSFRIPARPARDFASFAVTSCTADHQNNEPLIRCMRLGNLDSYFYYFN